MAKKPNAMGRIEADPKAKLNIPWKGILMTATVVALVILSIVSTLKYQEFIASTKADGVREYKTLQCDNYMNEDKSAKWFECETTRIENNQ